MSQLCRSRADVGRSLRAQTEALEAQATFNAPQDPLTGLPNRFPFKDGLAQALLAAARQQKRVAVRVMGLDRFKQINEAMGPYNGDRLLKQMAIRLHAVVQAPESVARLGATNTRCSCQRRPRSRQWERW
ncbi:GGDEF domain-containing protein [Thiobacter sp. AK1]|uniref:GGDEF domain-containing protein n=1 Tax=Thiobacter aerophilum TaxID=3121275 RepID=A0ABV0EB48_9BURK